jgi:fumarate hydratase class I
MAVLKQVAMIQLTTPISETAIRALKVGDEVAISGRLFTGRDAVHKYLHEGGKLPDGISWQGGIAAR